MSHTLDLALGPLGIRLLSDAPLRVAGTELEGFVQPDLATVDITLTFTQQGRLTAPTFNTPSLVRTNDSLTLTCVDGYELSLQRTTRTGTLNIITHAADGPANRAPLYLLAALKALCATLLIERGGLLLHASAVQLDDGARVFFGPSGAGKSTVAAMYPADAVLNDELVGITLGDTPTVWATPFSGTLNVPRRHRGVRLVGGFALSQATFTKVEPLTRPAALRLLLACVALPDGDGDLETLAFNHATTLAARDIWARLCFTKDPTAVHPAVRQGKLSA